MAKMSKRKFNELPNHTPIAIENVPFGCAIQKKPTAKKNFDVDGYCRYERKYQLTSHDDYYGDWQYLKKGTIVYSIDY